jgi:DNA-3-methyladenine glycosylase II
MGRPAADPLVAPAAVAHLRAADPVLAELIDRVGPLADPRRGRPQGGEHYAALVRAIVGQQLSVVAARAIYGRLLGLFAGQPPTPEQILAADPVALKEQAGLSRAKVGFLRSLAEHVLSGELELDRIALLPDEQLFAELVAVKGIGQWTADMFLIFQLGRPDVLPVGDLGVRKAAQLLYGLPALPTAVELERIGEPWRPHRSLASLYLWESLDNVPA